MEYLEDARQIRKLKELITHIDGQIEYIEHTLISNVRKSFESKYKSHLYKEKKEELSAGWEEEYQKIQTLLIAYKAQRKVLTDIVEQIRGGRINIGAMRVALQTVGNTIDNHLDLILDTLISEYPPANTISGNFVRRHVARSRSRPRSPVRTRLQSPVKSSFRNTKRHGRSRSRSPNRNGRRNRNRNRNGNRNENRKTTIRFNNRTRKYEIESLKTNNPFNNRSAVSHKEKETKNKSLRGSYHAYTIKAAANAAAAAAEAQDIISSISDISPIFVTIQAAAQRASTAAREAAHCSEIFDEFLDDATARQIAQDAVTARDVAIAALKQIKDLVNSYNPSAAAASSNPQNRT